MPTSLLILDIMALLFRVQRSICTILKPFIHLSITLGCFFGTGVGSSSLFQYFKH